MTESILSPGVLIRENNTSQIVQGPKTAGAAIVGPTVKGPVNIPTIVTSYSDYISKFGGSYNSGSIQTEYLTSISTYNYFQQGGTSLLVTRVTPGVFTPATSNISTNATTNSLPIFTLETLSQGDIMNSSSSLSTNGMLLSGSNDNIRWEIINTDTNAGTFSLLIRKGNDNNTSKSILETWNKLSLDPNSNNYIEAIIGNQYNTITDNNIILEGDFVNKSRYIRVKQVNKPTLNYFNNDGLPKLEFTNLLPIPSSGSFSGALGVLGMPSNNDYITSLNILLNKEEFQYDIITVPGLNQTDNPTIISLLTTNTQDRGDAIAIVDLTPRSTNISSVINKAKEIDNSYAASYHPYVQVSAPNTGKLTWVPPSTIIPSVYAYNDNVGAEWFAPAGFKRGGLSVIQAEYKLKQADRDALYQGKVNPIGTFPGQGVVVYGQKTLISKSSALDRINVRRLLIELKRYIGQVANTLVFENNTKSTRNAFLSKVRPYMDNIQQKQGLYAYKVIMDEENNDSSTIDQNQLVGQIYVQPAKTIEFILLDFNVSSTGVEF